MKMKSLLIESEEDIFYDGGQDEDEFFDDDDEEVDDFSDEEDEEEQEEESLTMNLRMIFTGKRMISKKNPKTVKNSMMMMSPEFSTI